MPILSKRVYGETESTPPGIARSTRAFWSQSPATDSIGSPGVPGGVPGQQPPPRRAVPRPRGLLSTCANPRCASGWLHLWRSRSGPIFEGGWSCSASCTAARVEAAVRREMEGRSPGEGLNPAQHRHRIPLGLVMLEQGWITSEQLRKAMDAQRAAGAGRLGDWLVTGQGVPETLVTRALSLQWNCPVLNLDRHEPEKMTAALPRLFVEAFAALPLRVAAERWGFSISVLTTGWTRSPGAGAFEREWRDLRVEPWPGARSSLFQAALRAHAELAAFRQAGARVEAVLRGCSAGPRSRQGQSSGSEPVESKLVRRARPASGCGCGVGPRAGRCRKIPASRM